MKAESREGERGVRAALRVWGAGARRTIRALGAGTRAGEAKHTTPGRRARDIAAMALAIALWPATAVQAQDDLSVSIACAPSSCKVPLGGTITLTATINRASTAGYEYHWQPGDGTVSGQGTRSIRWTTPAWEDTEASPFEGGYLDIDVAVYNADEHASSEVRVEITPKRKPGTNNEGNHPPTVSGIECKDQRLNTIACGLTLGAENTLPFIKLCAEAADADGWITDYTWESAFGSFSNQGNMCVEWHPPTRAMNASISVRVKDNKGTPGSRAYQTVAVEVESPSQRSTAPPQVRLTCDPCTVKRGEMVSLTTAASDDGSIEGYEWHSNVTGGRFIGDTSGPSVQWRAPDYEGEFFVSVTVTDDVGQTATRDVKITIARPENRHPTVEASCYPCTVEADAATRHVRLSAVGRDPDHNPLTYKWTSQRDAGHFVTSPDDDDTTWLPPATGGSYQLTVSVDDGNGGTASDTVVVSARRSQEHPLLTANAGRDADIARTAADQRLKGSAQGGAPGPLKYLWTQVEGPNVALQNATQEVARFVVPDVQSNTRFVFKLGVTDSVGQYDDDTVTLTARNSAPRITRIWCGTGATGNAPKPDCTFNPGDQFHVKWEASDPDGDRVNVGRNAPFDTELPTATRDHGTASIRIRIGPGAGPGRYEGTLRVVDERGAVSEPATLTVTVRRPNPVNAPTGLSASDVLNTEATLSWTAPANTAVTGYQILRAASDAETDDNDTFSIIVSNTRTKETQYRVTRLRVQTAYKFKVKAHMEDGGLTPASDSVRVVTAAADPDGTGAVRLSTTQPYTYQTLNTEAADFEDRFTFSVSGRKLLDFRVYQAQIPLDVVLENSRGETLTEGWNSEPEDNEYKQIRMALDTGSYTIRVRAQSGQTEYRTYFGLAETKLPNVSISLVARAVEDAKATLDFTVRLDQAVHERASVDYATRDGNARAGHDYTATSGTLTFEPGGATEQTISVAVLEDLEQEGSETLFVDLSNPDGLVIKHRTGRGLIGGTTLRVSDAQGVEEPGGSLSFVVSLSEEVNERVTVEYKTVDGTATAGRDYTSKSGTLTFAIGDVTKVVTVEVLDDSDEEGDETMTLRLSKAQGAEMVDGVGTGTIVPGTVNISIADATIEEAANAVLEFVVTLDQRPDGTVTVEYSTEDGSATSTDDYTADRGTLTFSGSKTEETVTINVTSDSTVEADETMTVRLFNAQGGAIARAEGTGTITSDGIGISVSDAEVEEESGATLDFTVTLDKAPAAGVDVTVEYATKDGTATDGNDYSRTSGTLTFAAGETKKEVKVRVEDPPHHRPANEPTETMTLVLSNPSRNAFLRDDTGIGTIYEENGFRIERPGPVVQEGPGATLDFKVTLARAEDSSVSVDYATRDGTSFTTEFADAVAGSDYTATSGTLTFAANEEMKTVSVPVLHDNVNEPTEVMELRLSNPSTGLGLLNRTVPGTITDSIGISVSDATVEEEEGATLDFEISLDRALQAGESVTITYTIEGKGVHDDATAEAGKDYKATSGSVTFREGDQTKTVQVEVKEDNEVEDTEVLFLKLQRTIPSNAPGFVIADNEGKGEITDRNGISAQASTGIEQPDAFGSGTVTFTVSLERPAADRRSESTTRR